MTKLPRTIALTWAVTLCALGGGFIGSEASAMAAGPPHLLTSCGAFTSAQGVAIDQSGGAVYVYDTQSEGGAIYKFNLACEPAEFSALHADVITGIGGLGQREVELAVDNSSGVAKGDIYAATGESGVVRVFGADGTSLGTLDSGVAGPWGEPCGVAVDPAGHVYLGLFIGSGVGSVNKYTPAANPVTNADYTSTMEGVGAICNIAVDSTGNLYTGIWESPSPVTKWPVEKFIEPSLPGKLIDPSGGTLAVDTVTDYSYIDEGSNVAQFNPSGTHLLNIGAGALSGSLGLAVYHVGEEEKLYVNNGSTLDVYGPSLLPIKPAVEKESALPTRRGALLEGEVNPEGSATVYYFEYVDAAHYNGAAPDPYSAGTRTPAVEAGFNIGGDKAGPQVLRELAPATVLHYRLVASNASGVTFGGDQQLEVLPATPPIIETQSVGGVTATAANISGVISSHGLQTSYMLEYGTSAGGYGTRIFGREEIGASAGPTPVAISLQGLAPGTEYHVRWAGINQDGTGVGGDIAFTTRSVPNPITVPPAPVLVPFTPLVCGRGQVEEFGQCVKPAIVCKKGQVARNGRCVPAPCKKGFVRKNGRCVKKKASHRRRKG